MSKKFVYSTLFVVSLVGLWFLFSKTEEGRNDNTFSNDSINQNSNSANSSSPFPSASEDRDFQVTKKNDNDNNINEAQKKVQVESHEVNQAENGQGSTETELIERYQLKNSIVKNSTNPFFNRYIDSDSLKINLRQNGQKLILVNRLIALPREEVDGRNVITFRGNKAIVERTPADSSGQISGQLSGQTVVYDESNKNLAVLSGRIKVEFKGSNFDIGNIKDVQEYRRFDHLSTVFYSVDRIRPNQLASLSEKINKLSHVKSVAIDLIEGEHVPQ